MSSAPRLLLLLSSFVIAALVFGLSLDDSWPRWAQNTAALAAGISLIIPFAFAREGLTGVQRYHRVKLAALIALAFVLASNLPYTVVNDLDPDRVTDPKLFWITSATAFLVPTMLLLLLALISPKHTTRISRWGNLVLILAAIGFGALEWSARSKVVPPSHRPVQEESWLIEQPDSEPRFVLRPDHTFLNTFASNPRGYFDANNQVAHRTNADGYRGPLRTLEKPDDVLRMLVLGDSTAYGWGVRDEHLITSLLEERLADKLGDRRFEGMILASPGYTTRDECGILRTKGLAYSPDLVVIWYAINDVAGQWDPKSEDAARAERLRNKPWYRSASKFIDETLTKIQQKIIVRRYNRDVGNYYYYDRKNWRAAKADVLEIRQLAESAGAKTIVVIEPPLFPLGRDSYPYRNAHKVIHQFCTENAIPYYDLWEAIVDMDCRELMVHAPPPTDPHPNDLARIHFADYLAEQMLKDNVLD